MKLVVVESPAKVKTVAAILGLGYRVMATAGHLYDLPRRHLGVDVERDFEPQYEMVEGKARTVRTLRSAASRAESVYLATDPDREGEAIAWQVQKNLPSNVPVYRVTFHEITAAAVRAAFGDPRSVDPAMVDAQRARRVLDRLVGYEVSPLLWSGASGQKRWSAGRVQTVALRLLVEREREIEVFTPEASWEVWAELAPHKSTTSFLAQLWRVNGEKPEIATREQAECILRACEPADFWVSKVDLRRRLRRPPPPFTTAALQQAASRTLRFLPRETMRIAQELYEGVDLRTRGILGDHLSAYGLGARCAGSTGGGRGDHSPEMG